MAHLYFANFSFMFLRKMVNNPFDKLKLSIESQIVKLFSGIDWHGGSECYQVWSKTLVNCAQREVIWVSRGLTILFFSPIFFETCCTSVANLVKVSSWESCFVPIVFQTEANFLFESFSLWNLCWRIETSAEVNAFHAEKVSHHGSKKSRCFLYISCKKSFVGKFAWWKNMFLLDLQKTKQRIDMKIKTSY